MEEVILSSIERKTYQTFEIDIPGNPQAKKRPRFAMRGKFMQVYNPNKMHDDEVREQLTSKWPHKPIEGPLELHITFYMPLAQGWSKKKQERALNEFHCSTVDIDNLLKKILDCLNEIVFKDDRQVYKVTALKKYDTKPRTCIKIMWQEP